MKTPLISRPDPVPTTNLSSNVPAVPAAQVMLSVPQDLALEWLMNGGSISEAAQFAGVCRQTVSRWLMTDPDFRAVYDAWREQIANITEGQLLGLSESAVATIASAIRDRRDTKSAQFVLKHLAMLASKK